MIKFSITLINILFISLLAISTKSSNETNTNFLSNAFLENKLKTDSINNENKLYDLIVEYKKKLIQDNIMKDFYYQTDIDESDSESNSNPNTNTNESTDFNLKKKFENIFIQKENEKFESFFNTTQFTWEGISATGEAPKSRKGQSMVISDTFLVIFGGRDLDDKYYNDVQMFDLQEKTWTTVTPIGAVPTPRAGHSAVIRGTTMWIFGGGSDAGYLNDLYSFDIDTVN